MKRAQQKILCIDEGDKTRIRRSSAHGDWDVGGEGVQQALPTLVEGCTVEVSVAPARGGKRKVLFDSSSVLVICGGAFQGLDDLVTRRIEGRGGPASLRPHP